MEDLIQTQTSVSLWHVFVHPWLKCYRSVPLKTERGEKRMTEWEKRASVKAKKEQDGEQEEKSLM